MGTEGFDYAAILNDLEAKKAAIEAALASLRSALAMGALGQPGELSVGGMGSINSAAIHSGDIPNGAFLGKSIPEGTKLYLQLVKQKQTTREIADAIRRGGMESTSKSFPNMVHSVLDRASKGNSGIVKLDKHWGLAGWYPAGLRSTAGLSSPSKKAGKKKQKKAAAKKATTQQTVAAAAAAAVKSVVTPISPMPQPEQVGIAQRVLQLLKNNNELTPQQIAQQLALKIHVVSLVLGNLTNRQHKLEKTPVGHYRLAPLKASAAV